MIFNPIDHNTVLSILFSNFKFGSSLLHFVTEFKYLGNMITYDLTDDVNIQREIRNMFVRANIPARGFLKCSTSVKVVLFRAYCISFYDASLWKFYKGSLSSCYNKCIKICFAYKHRDSMTWILFDLGLPSFNTVVVNSSAVFSRRYNSCSNSIIQYLCLLCY
jgi:hypothetical protein